MELRLPQLPESLDLQTLIRKLNLWGGSLPNLANPLTKSGNGSPEGVVPAVVATFYVQRDGVNGAVLWIKAAGTDAFGWVRTGQSPIPVQEYSILRTYGDSFTGGTGASPSTRGYAYQLAALLRAPNHDQEGVGGSGIYRAWKNLVAAGGNVWRTYDLVTLLAGFNDMRRGGGATKTVSKIVEHTRAFIAAQLLRDWSAANGVSVVQVGVWSSYSTSACLASVIGGSARSGLLGGSLSYDFTGDALAVGYVVGDGVSAVYGTATVTIDGVLAGTLDGNSKTDGISDGTDNNVQGPAVAVYRGLGTGTHTVVVAPQHASRPFIVDYFGHMASPMAACPVLVGEIPRCNAAGYAVAPAAGSDGAVATINAALRTMVDEFASFPVALVPSNAYYTLATDVDTDNIHPNNTGHLHFAEAFLSAMSANVSQNATGVIESTALGPNARAEFQAATAVGFGATAGGLNTAAFGRTATASAINTAALGSQAAATAIAATAVGTVAAASAVDTTAVGHAAAASGTDCTALGADAAAGNAGAAIAATAVGSQATASFNNATAVGFGATASTKDSATAVGRTASATGQNSTAVGASAAAAGDSGSAYGRGSSAATANATAIGFGATANGGGSPTALGASASATQQNTVAVGQTTTATAAGATAVGQSADATASNATAIGKDAQATHATATAIGAGAATTAANQVMLGTATEQVVVPGNLKYTGLYAPGSVTVPTGSFGLQVKRLQLTGTQRLSVAGTGRYTVIN